MHLRARSTFAFGSALVALGAGTRAYAQTTTTTTATTGPTVTLVVDAPTRTVNGVVVNPRPQNLTPLGINYSDCISNMVLDFSVLLTVFSYAGMKTFFHWWHRRRGPSRKLGVMLIQSNLATQVE